MATVREATLDQVEAEVGSWTQAVVVDLTDDPPVPTGLLRPGAPPIVGICRGQPPDAVAALLAAVVQSGDGPDAVISAVRRVGR